MDVKELFDNFMDTHYDSSWGKRDNCGVAAIELVSYLQKEGVEARRVFGWFFCDEFLHDKKDFTLDMIEDLKDNGLDFDNKEDRKSYIKLKMGDEWKKCPHYWVVAKGQILDPSGYAQFVLSGLASDLSKERYLP